MARFTRHDLKQDAFRTAFEEYEQFAKQHLQEIFLLVGILIAAVGSVLGLRFYSEHREAEANAKLGAALKTFRAYVGAPPQGILGADEPAFPTAREKYQKALTQFAEVTQAHGFQKLLPRPKAIAIARYHMGLCQAGLGDEAGAMKSFEEAARDRDRNIAALPRFAEAALLAKDGKVPEAVKIYQDLADHPSSTVPRASALLAMAEAYQATQPAKSREIYERMAQEFGSDVSLADALRQRAKTLTH